MYPQLFRTAPGRILCWMAARGKASKAAIKWRLLLSSLIAVLPLTPGLLTGSSASENKPPAQQSGAVVEATKDQLAELGVEQVREAMLDDALMTTGRVGFNEDRLTPIFTPYAGRVMEIRANKGELVKAGQKLLVVETPDLLSAVNDLAEAHADEDKARIGLSVAEKSAERARTLHAQEALATKELQASESDLERAKDDFRRAQAGVMVARDRLMMFGKSEEEINDIERADARDVDRRIDITAPLAGTIVDRKVGLGQYIKPDATDPLFLIGDLSGLWVNADVYENSLAQIRVGSPVQITVVAYPGRVFTGKIASISPTVDPTTRTLHVRCVVENPAGLLKPEMFAAIRISGGVAHKVLTVPTTAVLTLGATSFVFAEVSTGKFERRSVTTAGETQGRIIVESGLRPADRIASRSVLLLNSQVKGK